VISIAAVLLAALLAAQGNGLVERLTSDDEKVRDAASRRRHALMRPRVRR
jgi:hypothetical protein